jgi:hypothetical protein
MKTFPWWLISSALLGALQLSHVPIKMAEIQQGSHGMYYGRLAPVSQPNI